MLREHGPDNRDFLCAMHTLRTWMDEKGFAWPSLRTWAKGARMAVGTLRKHVARAQSDGWLSIGDMRNPGKGWRCGVYRCAVPMHIVLTDKDRRLADTLVSKFGEITEAVSTLDDTPARAQGDAVSTTGVTPRNVGDAKSARNRHATPDSGERVSNGCAKLYQKYFDGVLKNRARVSPSVTPKSSSEVMELPYSEEAAQTRNTDLGLNEKTDAKESKEIRLQKAGILMRMTPDIEIGNVAMMFKLTETEVKQIRGSL